MYTAMGFQSPSPQSITFLKQDYSATVNILVKKITFKAFIMKIVTEKTVEQTGSRQGKEISRVEVQEDQEIISFPFTFHMCI